MLYVLRRRGTVSLRVRKRSWSRWSGVEPLSQRLRWTSLPRQARPLPMLTISPLQARCSSSQMKFLKQSRSQLSTITSMSLMKLSTLNLQNVALVMKTIVPCRVMRPKLWPMC
eukprot:Lithocolla_globosa_v1_NODE_1489_length_2538_cov_14.496979.p3 type:complete len:113 gc:universal NODE_1489_length_2538_cov_14.496979:1513-1175(-)